MIYPDRFEQKTGFDKVRTFVQNKCITQSAKEKAERADFSYDRDKIIRLLSQTAEMKTICMMDDSFPDSGYVDTCRFLSKIKTTGSYLDPVELLNLKTAFVTVNNISSYFNKKGEEYPALKALVSSATQNSYGEKYFMSTIVEEIDRIIDNYGQVKDNASMELYDIRKEIHSKQSIVGKRIQLILKSAQSEGIVEQESGITMRDGHAVIPVLAMNKRKLKGLVVGESSTGRTVFIEPMEVVELNNSIRELEFAEQREIVKILVAITEFMRPSYENIAMAGDILTEIDFIRGKAYYAIETESGMPIITDELRIYLKKAKHPVLMKALAKEKKEVVPLDIDLSYDRRILLVSGPNAGGKSVCIKTVGLLQYMLQCGFLIPASEVSEMSIFKNIFIDIGDEQSLENDLSTYSSHLTNMKIFMKNADKHTLILIDEFGTGTEPSAGGAIAEAVLTDILKKKTFGLITTHYTNLKYFASSTEGIVNGAMLFDSQNIQPLFKLETGIPGSSFAFEIARKIGLHEDVLKDAESKLGNKQVKIEKSLKKISKDKKYWESKRDNIKKTDKKLEELSEKYEKELIEIKEIRKKLINEAKEEAQKILASVNKEIENTIRIIKESQADKEKTKLARSKLEELKKTVAGSVFTDDKIEREIQKIKNRQAKKHNKQNKSDNVQEPANQSDLNIIDNRLSSGDKVKIKGQIAVGEIISVGNNNIAVAFGNIIMNLAPDKIEKVSRDESRNVENSRTSSITSDLLVKRLNFKSVLDVRGERTLDALEQVSAFVDEAVMLGISEVRILHGKGTGILKEEIRRYLKASGNASSFFDEQEESGGAGITVVQFNYR
ncbi:MAG: Smr/MutS family protein [Prevotellaceae bacterium]|jgi:DNA mismatch repair protein MutS2|nr:Smr/MutS family protein [Prevotellaceae bacterium]